MLLAMIWQTLAWLTPLHLDEQKEAIAHTLAHAQEVGHHHHADQTLQVENGGGEPAHQHANQAAQLPGLPPTMMPTAGDPVSSVLVASVGIGHAPVFLEGSLRPPQCSAEPG